MAILPSPAIPANPSPQLALALKWAEAVSKADFDVLSSILTDDHIHHLLPTSLGVPVLNGKEALFQVYKGVLPHFRESKVRYTLHFS